MRSETCGTCGEGNFRETNVRGKSFPFKDEPAVSVGEDVILPVCDACGEMRLDAHQTEAFSSALGRSYKRGLIRKQRALINDLCEMGITQQQLERALALSPGYASKLRTGKVASVTTYRFLYLLHARPSETLQVLARMDPSFVRVAEKITRSVQALASGGPRDVVAQEADIQGRTGGVYWDLRERDEFTVAQTVRNSRAETGGLVARTPGLPKQSQTPRTPTWAA